MFVPSLAALLVAAAIDRFLPEPPNRLHPVAWMGSAIGVFQRYAPAAGRTVPLLAGAGFVLVGILLVASIAAAAAALLSILPWPARILGEAMLLKTTFSICGLAAAARSVHDALHAGDLGEARRRLAWHLVSRNTESLDESQVSAAAIESVAENASDSVIAPFFFYLLGGLPGAFMYRFVNTCDAMLGYRDQRREWLGKVPARFDDVLNLLPARITAVLMAASGRWMGADLRSTAKVWRRDRLKTASPNAGHPMSAAAGVLGIELEKVDHYCLGKGLATPTAADILRSVHLLNLTAGSGVLLTGVAILLRTRMM